MIRRTIERAAHLWRRTSNPTIQRTINQSNALLNEQPVEYPNQLRNRRSFHQSIKSTIKQLTNTPSAIQSSDQSSLDRPQFVESSMSIPALLLIGGVTYIAASLICLYFPSILAPILDEPINPSNDQSNSHSIKRPKLKNMSHLRYGAHRGGGCERVENTIDAFDHALSCGCTLLELDVRLSRDRQVVVTHDGDVIRTTGRSGQVGQFDYDDLPINQSVLPSPPPFSTPGTMTRHVVDAQPGSEQHNHAYQMPLLDTVLERYPQSIINIDCKDDSLELADAIADLIDKHDAHDRVIVGSMHQRAMDRISERLPNATKFFNPKSVFRLYLRYATGLLPFTRLEYDALEIPYITREFKAQVKHMAAAKVGERVAEMTVDALAWFMLRPSFIRHLQQRGVPVIVWVINSEDEINAAFARGVTGVMTDRPSLIKNIFPEASDHLQRGHPATQTMH